MVVIVYKLDLQLHAYSVPIITKTVISILFTARCTRYNIIWLCVSDLWQVGGCCRVLRFPPPIKLTATI